MPSNVVIVDYGAGNLHSVKKSLERMGVKSAVSSTPDDVISAEKIILPGVGHFGKAMTSLLELNLIDALNEAVLVKQRPIFGICLGMELMGKKSEEGDAYGLGWFDAEIVRFDISNRLKYKVPHIGWNRLRNKKDSILMNGVAERSEFYFIHSYHLKPESGSDVMSETNYEVTFPSAIEKNNIFGVQFHPEKSHDAGAQMLKNFVEL